VEVHPDDQSSKSFDEAMVLWLDDHLPMRAFSDVNISGCFFVTKKILPDVGNGLWSMYQDIKKASTTYASSRRPDRIIQGRHWPFHYHHAQ